LSITHGQHYECTFEGSGDDIYQRREQEASFIVIQSFSDRIFNILPSHFPPASGFGGELTVTYLSHPARGNLVRATLLAPATCRQP
jgi:hypothetical protein